MALPIWTTKSLNVHNSTSQF